MKFNFSNINLRVSPLFIIRAYKFLKRLLHNKKLGIKIRKHGCPVCHSDLEVSPLFKVCVKFGQGCNYCIIKGLKINDYVQRMV
jgi:hypothetical protein